jgi:hypothetical protein
MQHKKGSATPCPFNDMSKLSAQLFRIDALHAGGFHVQLKINLLERSGQWLSEARYREKIVSRGAVADTRCAQMKDRERPQLLLRIKAA